MYIMQRNVFLALALMTTLSLSAQNFKSGNLYFNVLKGKTVEVTVESNDPAKNYSDLTVADVPATVDVNGKSYQVVAIGDRAFAGNQSIKTVTIPETVTSINPTAFDGCSNVETVVWNPKSFSAPKREVDGPLYDLRSSVKRISFGDKVADIPVALCFDMVNLTTIDMNAGLKTIGAKAFSGCRALEHIDIANNVKSIGDKAFYNCVALKEITIPQSVSSIHKQTFEGCTSLSQINWNPQTYAVKKDIDAPFNVLRKQITKVSFGDKVKAVPAYFCAGMERLDTISLPNSVTAIENNAFDGCSGLKKLYLSSALTTIGKEAFKDCSMLPEFIVGNNVKTLGEGAFEECKQLQSINLGAALKDLPKECFKGCLSLTEINVPKTITKIGDEAFEDCSSLKNVVFNEGLLTIGKEVFKHCSAIDTVVLPQSLTDLGESAFEDCRALAKINIPVLIKIVNKNTFDGCYALNDIQLGDGVKEIAKDAFKGCSAITQITIPLNVTSIAKTAFADCAKLETIAWNPKSYGDIKKAPDGPFAVVAAQIKNITFGEQVTRIPMHLCSDMTGLTVVDLPANILEIGKEAFSGCTSLATVNFANPSSMVEAGAFEETTELKR